jgi:putative addiction module CopG family antidote
MFDMLSSRSETMTKLELDPKLVAIIQQKVDAGLYDDADDFVRTALNLLEADDRHRDWLRREAQAGLDELNRGNSVLVDDIDAFFDMIKIRAAERRAAGIPISDAVKP